MAADPAAFPDQLRFVQPWQAKRLYFNLFNWSRELEEQNEKAPNTLAMDYGTYDPVLGFSYTEIAGMSRSQHRSQGMGSPERKGASRNHLELLAGEPAANDPFDGIETSWSRLEGGAAIGKLISEAIAQFQPEQPHRIVPLLAQARQLIAARSDAWSKRKLTEIDETIALCAGIWADASSDRAELVPGSTAKVTVSVINRSPLPAAIVKASVAGAAKADLPLEPNKMASIDLEWKVPAEEPLSQPYWLRAPKDGPRYAIARQELVGLPENPPLLVASIVAKVSGVEIELTRPLHYRYVDRADGELVRPVAVVPAVAVSLAEKVYLFPSPAPRNVEVTLLPKQPRQTVQLSLKTPPGWNVEPRVIQAELGEANAQQSFTFRLTPGASPRKGKLEAQLNGQAAFGIDVIRYPHIPPQTLFPPADAELVPVTVTTLSKNIGYIMGAGDDVPDSLRQLGCTVTLLSSEDLSHGDLSRFDAIVTGVRAFNTRIDLRANQGRLFQYVKEGGTMLVQYNVADSRFWAGGQSLGKTVGPFPLEVGAGRVTDENAAVETLTASPLLQKPNAIVADDWKGWVQERGLYYPATWDPQYQPLFRMADPGEKPQDGSTLVARYGKGVYIYTALSWFRQLPAGVPGAYRIFANLLSASKIQ